MNEGVWQRNVERVGKKQKQTNIQTEQNVWAQVCEIRR